MLGGLALQVPQLVDAAALDRCPRPGLPDGAAQAGVAVDDAEQRGLQPPRAEAVQAPLHASYDSSPRSSNSTSTFLAAGKDAHDGQDRDTHHLTPAADAQREGVEVGVGELEVAQGARLQASRLLLSVATIHETTLRDSGVARSSEAVLQDGP
jgi:hypothetical protein